MTVDAAEVTDDEVAGLIARHGEAKVTAMVLLLAYANYQDRLLPPLDVPIEAGGSSCPSRFGSPKADLLEVLAWGTRGGGLSRRSPSGSTILRLRWRGR